MAQRIPNRGTPGTPSGDTVAKMLDDYDANFGELFARPVEGPQGDPGPKGDPGDPGADGAPGTPGADGKTMHSTTGAPSAGLGVDGDYALDVAAGDLYGPKAAGAWPGARSLVGPQGPQGEPGTGGEGGTVNMLRHGTTAPSDALGINGDFYINTTADELHGPKAGGVWPTGVSLVGPQGVKGDTGDVGPQGVKGDKGDPGDPGTPGSDGADGADGRTIWPVSGAPSGSLGVDDDFAIDSAAGNLYGPKTTGAWGSARSLVGPQGDQGIQGDQGVKGDTGDVGPQGDPGVPGADGKTLRNGTGAPAGGLGVDDDFYIDTAADAIYGPKTGGAWGSATSLVGPQGPQGEPGGGSSAVTVVKLASDVSVSSGTANNLNDITGLSFPVVSGTAYYFRFVLMVVSSVTTTGIRVSINGPAFTFLAYRSTWPLTATTEQNNPGLTAYDQPAAAGATALADEQVAIIEGIVVPSANGNVIGRFAREVNSGTVTVKAGSLVMVS